jgi:hypothetical protein
MVSEMGLIRGEVNAHVQRDMEAGRKWVCNCEACQAARPLVGLDKMFVVWPIVREIRQVEERLENLPEGQESHDLRERYYNLHDRLSDVMAK